MTFFHSLAMASRHKVLVTLVDSVCLFDSVKTFNTVSESVHPPPLEDFLHGLSHFLMAFFISAFGHLRVPNRSSFVFLDPPSPRLYPIFESHRTNSIAGHHHPARSIMMMAIVSCRSCMLLVAHRFQVEPRAFS